MAQTFGALLGQLVLKKRRVKGLTQTQLAEDAFGNPGKTRRISELENGSVANPHSTTIDPIISVLGISEEELEHCVTLSKIEPSSDWTDEEAKELFALLARRYDEDYPNSSLDDLSAFLHEKADEWVALKARLRDLEEISEHIKDLVLDAERLLSSGNFDAADDALKEAEQRFQTEKASKVIQTIYELRVARGDGRLLAGELNSALSHYIAAAEYFRPFDQQKMVEKLDELAGQIYEASRRSLRPAYTVASGLLEHVLSLDGIGLDAPSLAKYQYRLGLINRNAHADRRDGEPSEQLEKAILFASKAVEMSVALDDIHQRGCARISLANCLREKALLDDKKDKKPIHEVIKLLEDSKLEIESENVEDKSLLTHIYNNLGSAYDMLASISGEQSRSRYKKIALENFRRSVSHSETFLDVDTWAGAKINIGSLLWERSKLKSISTEEANFLRLQALAEYIAASETYPQTLFPLRAGELNFQVGGLLNDIAINSANVELAELYMARAISALLAAETVFDEKNHLERWSKIQMLLGYVFSNHSKITDSETSKNDIDEAISRFGSVITASDTTGQATIANECRRIISELRTKR